LIVVLTALLVLPTVMANAQSSVIEMEGNVPNGLVMRIPNTGFDFATDLAETLINAIDLNAFILAMNPVYPEECLTIASIGVNITQSHIGDISFGIGTTPIPGMGSHPNDLYVEMVIAKEVGFNNLFEFNAFGDIACFWPSYSVTASVDATQIELGMAVAIDYSPSTGLEVTVDEIIVNLVDFAFDINNFPDTIEDWIAGELENIFEDIAADLGMELIQDLIEDELGNINLSGDTPFSGYNLHYELDPALFTDSTGATFNSDMQLFLSGTTVDPCVDPGVPVGSRFTDNDIGVFHDVTPGGNPFQLGVAFSDDIFNQLLFSIYAKGMLCWGPESISKDKKMTGHDFVNLFRGKIPDKEMDKIKDAQWLFAIYPVNPPTIEVGLGSNDLSLVIEDMRFDWLLFREGRFVELLNASFDIDIGLDIEMDVNSNLIITFNQPTIIPNIHDSSFNVLPMSVIQPLLDTLIGFVQIMLENLIPPIPVPGFAGFSLIIEEVAPMGIFEDYLGIFISVESPIKAAASGEPDTLIVLSDIDGNILSGSDLDLNNYESSRFGLKDGREITVGFEAVGGGNVSKYYYKIDDSGWRLVKGNQVTIGNLIEGEHTFYVKAKNAQNIEDLSPAGLNFTCDNVPPKILGIEISEGSLHVNGWDYIDDNLKYVFTIDDALYVVQSDSPELSFAGLSPKDHKIDITVIDSSGNISRSTSVTISIEGDTGGENKDDGRGSGNSNGKSGEARGAEDDSLGGCHVGSSSGGNTALLLSLILLFPLFVKSYRRTVFLAKIK